MILGFTFFAAPGTAHRLDTTTLDIESIPS